MKSIILMLDHIEDPHNLELSYVHVKLQNDGIIMPKDRSVQVNSTVMKVSTVP